MASTKAERKVVIIGDPFTGKTSLLHAWPKQNSSLYREGVWQLPWPDNSDFFIRNQTINIDGTEVSLLVWDSCAYEDYHRLRQYTYSKTDVVLVTFAINKPGTLRNVMLKWRPEIKRYFSDGVPFLLLGCKADIRTQPELVSSDTCLVSFSEGEAVAAEIGACGYLECSAWDLNVDTVFQVAARACFIEA